jgi:DnaD/phage-associated family protein
MSSLVMGLVWELPETPDFGRAEKIVLLAYADHADSNGRNIYPSVDLMSRKTFYGERAVQMTTRKLEKAGYLIPDGKGPHGTNRWRIPIVTTEDGGAKIAPPQNKDAKNAPEGIAPEGIAPEPSVEVFNPPATAGTRGEVFRMFEQEIGILTPMIRDAINAWQNDVPHQWIIDAMRRAVVANKRSWAYVEAILKAWKAKGAQDTRSKQERGSGNKSGASARQQDAAAIIDGVLTNGE